MTLEERHLRLPNIGRVRLKETCRERGFGGRVLAATISRRADRWFVSLTVERESEIVSCHKVRGSRQMSSVSISASRTRP